MLPCGVIKNNDDDDDDDNFIPLMSCRPAGSWSCVWSFLLK